MIPCNLRKLATLVISLVIQVISLSGLAFAAAAPIVTVRALATDGVRAPVRIANDPSGGFFYVTDPRAGGVLKMNYQRKLVQTIKTVGVPQGVAVGTAGATLGKILVSQGTFVSVYNQDGTEQSRLGSGVGQFVAADGITVDSTGNIYVVDTRAKAIKVFHADGTYWYTFNTWTNVTAKVFSLPTGIAYEKAANQIAVVDSLDGKVYFFNITGTSPYLVYNKWVGAYQAGVGGNLKFQTPTGVAFEYLGSVLNRMYVLDSFQGSAQVIDPAGPYNATTGTGTFLSKVGGYGVTAGKLVVPYDIMYDGAHNLLLVTNGNSNVTAFGIGTVTPNDWDVDPGCPAIVINNPPAPNPDGSVVITGTTTNATSVAVTATSPTAATAVIPPVVTWSSTITGLVPGDNVITATAGNAGFCKTSANKTIAFTGSGLYVTGNPAPLFTNVPRVDLSGTVTAGASVSVRNQEKNEITACTVTGTSWACNNVPLQNGANTFTVTASKLNYSNVTATDFVVTLDTVPPVLTVSAISGGSSANSQLLNVTGKASDAHLASSVTVNGQITQVVANGVFSAAVVLASGENEITVVAADLAGNETVNTRFVHFDFDPARPVITLNNLADPIYTQGTSVVLSGTVVNGDSLLVAGVPVTINANNTWSKTVSALSTGMNTVEIVATSLTGKTSSVKLTVFSDAVKPAFAVTVPAQDLATNSVNNLVVSGTVSSGTVTATFNGLQRTVTQNIGTFSADLGFLPAGQQNYPLVVTVTDGANVETIVRNILVDRTQPVLTVDAANSTTLTITGAAADAGRFATAKVEILDNGTTPIGTVVLNTNGTWTADMTGVTYDPLNATSRATDVAANTSVVTLQAAVSDGDMNIDRLLSIADATYCLRGVTGLREFTLKEIGHGDCAPLNAGACSPDGKVNLPDCMLILRRAVGLDPNGPLWPIP